MEYPRELKPDSVEQIEQSPGHNAEIPKVHHTFKEWTGEPVEDTYNNKKVLDIDGEPVFAELGILRLCQQDGWEDV